MKLSILHTCLFLSLLLQSPFSAQSQCTWNGSTGVWSDASKWSCGHAPLPADNVVINAGTITLDLPPEVNNFTMTNGTITGAYALTINSDLSLSTGTLGNTGNVTVSGALSWTSGILGSADGTATGTITVAGAATLSSASLKRLYAKTLNLNSGGSYSGNGTITIGYGGTLNIPAGQTFAANVTATVPWTATTGGGNWNNAGTFDKQGSGALTIGFAFNNSSAVQVADGELNLSNGGVHNGSFSMVSAATLEFSGGTHNLSTSTLSNTGTLIVSGGTVTLPNNSTHTDVTVGGGTANFSGSNTMDDLLVSGGALNLSGSLAAQTLTMTNGTVAGVCPISIAGNLSLSTGTLGNTGNVTVSGALSWTSGILGSADGTATGTITVAGAATLSSASLKRLYGKTLNLNSGGSYSGNGSITIGYGGTLNIPAGQTFAANVTATVSWTATTGGGTWNNAGTFDKQGSGALTIGFAFNNSSAVQVADGELNLSNGGVHNGSFSMASAATLEFSGGTHNLSTSTLSSTGSLIVSGGTVTLPNNSTHTDVTVGGGTANFSGINTMDDLLVSGGTLNLSGSLAVQTLTMTNGTVAGVCPISIAGNLSVSTGTLGNTGNVTVSGALSWTSGILGSADGTATGTITVAGAATLSSASLKRLYGKTLNLNSGGSYSGNGSITIGYGGTLNIPTGQTFTANVTAAVSWTATTGGGTWNNAGTFDKQGSGALTIGFVFNNTGIISGAGSVTFSGTFSNTGLISPGASPGILNLNKTTPGLAVQDLSIELEGPTPGAGGYDQLNNTSGALNLNGGVLTVTLLNGYLPDVGTSFVIAIGTSRTGAFGTLNLPVENTRWTVTYNTTNVTLTVAAPLPVQWIDFQVNKKEERVLLDWSVAFEHNNLGFGIERSVNGRDFEDIYFVAGKGDSDVPTNYAYTDDNAPSATALYYRLRQEDRDGQVSYSVVRTVSGVMPIEVLLYPNPATDQSILQIDIPDVSEVHLRLLDGQGRICQQRSYTVSERDNTIPLSFKEMPPGSYLLQIQADAFARTILMAKE